MDTLPSEETSGTLLLAAPPGVDVKEEGIITPGFKRGPPRGTAIGISWPGIGAEKRMHLLHETHKRIGIVKFCDITYIYLNATL